MIARIFFFPQLNQNTGNQFSCIKRFCYVVTGTLIQKTFDNVDWSWTKSEYIGFSSSGVHIGSGNYPAKTWTISTVGIEGTITSVKVKASAAGKATLAVKVGTMDFQYKSNTNITLSSTSTEYEFTGSATGTIAITMKASTKAMYLNSIAVTYSLMKRNCLTPKNIRTAEINAETQMQNIMRMDAMKRGTPIIRRLDIGF